MGRSNRYTAEQVATALRSSQGLVSVAARKLECRTQTIYNYIKKYKSVEQARFDAREQMIDMAEVKLIEKIREGHLTAIIFALKTVGKNRGYVERREIKNIVEMVREMPDRELDDLIREFEQAANILPGVDKGETQSTDTA
jgi:hypothetical protein